MTTNTVEICKVQIVIVTSVNKKEVKEAKINLSSDILVGLAPLASCYVVAFTSGLKMTTHVSVYIAFVFFLFSLSFLWGFPVLFFFLC